MKNCMTAMKKKTQNWKPRELDKKQLQLSETKRVKATTKKPKRTHDFKLYCRPSSLSSTIKPWCEISALNGECVQCFHLINYCFILGQAVGYLFDEPDTHTIHIRLFSKFPKYFV